MWQGVAYGPGADAKVGALYIGDIGDPTHIRADICIYRIPEPLLSVETRIGTPQHPLLSESATRLLFLYPDGAHDAETLLVHPKSGAIYLVTKEETGDAGVYRFPPIKKTDPALKRYMLEKIGMLAFNEKGQYPFPNRVIGGDVAPDGRRVVLRTYYAAYEWRLPDGEPLWDRIWATTPVMIPLPAASQGAGGICYAPDGLSLLSSSRAAPATVYELRAK